MTVSASKAISQSLLLLLLLLVVLPFSVSAKTYVKYQDVKELQIVVKYMPKSCEVQAHNGDRVKVHYRGQLTNGTVFDSSYGGDPFEFVLGKGEVIKGWDEGILDMCLTERRLLKIPAKLGYGERGVPHVIPGGATLIFDTELMAVSRK